MNSGLALFALLSLQLMHKGVWCQDSCTACSEVQGITNLIYEKISRKQRECHSIKWLLVFFWLIVLQNKYKIIETEDECRTAIH